jgi:putative glutamine amidotransferase
MNVHRGGSLNQFLPDQQRDEALEHRRLAPGDSSRRHAVKLEPGTRLAAAIGKGEISVNTRHKQSVNRPGKGLRVIAKAPDGVVEAIEDPSHPFFHGRPVAPGKPQQRAGAPRPVQAAGGARARKPR